MKILVFILTLLLATSAFANLSITHVTGNHTITSSEDVTLLGGSTFYNVTMPSCSSTNDGEYHVIRDNSNGNQCPNVCPVSGQKMDGIVNGCYGICNYQGDNFVCDGSNNDWIGTSYWN